MSRMKAKESMRATSPSLINCIHLLLAEENQEWMEGEKATPEIV
jgi:hypothetical protein